MKTLRIELSCSVLDLLQFHNKSVQILSYMFKFHSIMEEEHVGNVVRFIFKAGEQPVEIIIDTADLLQRLFDIGRAACVPMSVPALGDDDVAANPAAVESALASMVTKTILSSSDVYWFELDNALSLSTLDSYFRTKRFESINDTVRNCALAISVINDCYQLLRYGPSFAKDHKLCLKSMVTPYQVLKIWSEAGWRTTKVNRSLTLLTTYQHELVSRYGQNFFFDIIASDEQLCLLGHSDKRIWSVHILREVFALLWSMPPYLRDEARVVVESGYERY